MTDTRGISRSQSALLFTGILLATLSEAVASTVLAVGRFDIIGDTHATPDEFALLDVSYTALKLLGFIVAPSLMVRIEPRRLLIVAALTMGLSCAVAAATSWLDLLIGFRAIQGFAGGVLLVTGQALVFLIYPRARQPFLQALYAIGAVVAPATIAPALEGWLVDAGSWSWIFFGGGLTAFAALVPILMTPQIPSPDAAPLRVSLTSFALLGIAIVSVTFALNQGARWNWFEGPLIVWSSALGLAGILAFVGRQLLSPEPRLLDYSAFGSADFTFAFIVSFVAGAALFGSAYLIPSFAVSVLAFTPTDAGLLLLPSGALFVGALLLSAFLVQKRGVPPIATVPLGILATMAAMWLLSLTTIESGADDMTPAILLRGAGLGFLFLAITLVAFNTLKPQQIASAIGLFNVGRQLGGLIGIAGLQTLIQHDISANLSVLSAGISSGAPAATERLAALTTALGAQGLDGASAQQAAHGLLARTVLSQATVLAYNSAFGVLALLFVVAAPLIVATKLILGRRSQAARTLHDASV